VRSLKRRSLRCLAVIRRGGDQRLAEALSGECSRGDAYDFDFELHRSDGWLQDVVCTGFRTRG